MASIVYKYRMFHSLLNNCISLDRIMLVTDDDGNVSQSEPHTCAFSPLQLDDLIEWLDGNCPEYVAVVNLLWTQEVKDAYASQQTAV